MAGTTIVKEGGKCHPCERAFINFVCSYISPNDCESEACGLIIMFLNKVGAIACFNKEAVLINWRMFTNRGCKLPLWVHE